MTVEKFDSESWLLASANPTRRLMPRILAWASAIYSAISGAAAVAPDVQNNASSYYAALIVVVVWAYINYAFTRRIAERAINLMIEKFNKCVFTFEDEKLTNIQSYELVVWKTRLTKYLSENNPRRCNDRWLPLEIEFKFVPDDSESKSIAYRISVLIFYAIANENSKRNLRFDEVAMIRNSFKESLAEDIFKFHRHLYPKLAKHNFDRDMKNIANQLLYSYSREIMSDYIFDLKETEIVL